MKGAGVLSERLVVRRMYTTNTNMRCAMLDIAPLVRRMVYCINQCPDDREQPESEKYDTFEQRLMIRLRFLRIFANNT